MRSEVTLQIAVAMHRLPRKLKKDLKKFFLRDGISRSRRLRRFFRAIGQLAKRQQTYQRVD